jgi:CBS domain-containing protein
MHNKEIMSQPVRTCRSDDTLNRAAQLMWEHDCGAIAVVDQEGRLIGIVTDRDICMAAYTRGLPLTSMRVDRAMAKQVFTVHPEDSIAEAEKLMSEKQVRRIPVVDAEGKPVGIVSVKDLASEAVRGGRLKGRVVEVLNTLVAICRSRGGELKAAARRLTPGSSDRRSRASIGQETRNHGR